MATRKLKKSEMAQAADSLAEAAQHVGQAVSQKLDQVGSVFSARRVA